MAKKTSTKFEGDIFSVTFIESGEELLVDMNDLSQEIILKLAKHGLKQKICDSYAGADAGESFVKAKGVADDLIAGNWTTRVAASGPRTTQLAEALAAATDKPLEEAAERIEQMDDEQKKALRTHPHIKAALANIRAEKAAAAAAKAAQASSDAPALEI